MIYTYAKTGSDVIKKIYSMLACGPLWLDLMNSIELVEFYSFVYISTFQHVSFVSVLCEATSSEFIR